MDNSTKFAIAMLFVGILIGISLTLSLVALFIF